MTRITCLWLTGFSVFGLSVFGLSVFGLAACENSVHRGGEGESCTRRDDCEASLRCRAQQCVTPDGAPAGDAGVQPPSDPVTRGQKSALGETCAASNDCRDDLACVNSVCARVSLPFEVTPKQCHRVECAQDAECCAGFVPDANCPSYQANCEADPVFCNTYRSLCECSMACVEELCVAAPPGCTMDGECTSQQTPFCVESVCVQCDRDASCPGEGTKCIEGVCTAACELDEQCPLLHACQEGECIEVGCSSDRECVFMTKDPTSVCQEAMCETPCMTDTDCGQGGANFEACSEGRCVFVGCESDAECRALIGPFSPEETVRAVCR